MPVVGQLSMALPIALWASSGSGKQTLCRCLFLDPQNSMTSATWLRWCCLFAGAVPAQAAGGGPLRAPGGLPFM